MEQEITASKLRTLGKYLGKYEPKKHGGYYIYNDDKIITSYDTYYPNFQVKIKTPKGLVCVALGSDQIYSIYRPGKWEFYVVELWEKAKEIHRQKEKEEQEKLKIEQEKLFGNVSEEMDSLF